jgi:hypothetical protein
MQADQLRRLERSPDSIAMETSEIPQVNLAASIGRFRLTAAVELDVQTWIARDCH